MQTIIQDLRYGLRVLSNKPTFTLIAILTLALGIGANTAIFSVVDAVLLRSLPYADADKLMQVGIRTKTSSLFSADQPKFLFWREHNQVFEALTAQGFVTGLNLSGGNEPEYVNGMKVSADYFRVFQVEPALGRSFSADEDRSGANRVAVLTDGLWKRRFGASADVIGQAILINSEPHTVIGVLPAQFQPMSTAELLTPLQPNVAAGSGDNNYEVIGRLKDGVTMAQALSDLQRVGEEYRAAFPQRMTEDESVNLQPYKEEFVEDIRLALWLLLGAVSFVLLIACANVASLQLVRAAERQREMAVRMALGAGFGRIIRQLMTEGIALSLVGGALGLLLALWGTDGLLAITPEGLLPHAHTIGIDGRVLAFTLFTAVLTGVLFALAPAWQAARTDLNQAIKEASGKGVVGVRRSRLRQGLVIGEIALSLILLIGATLLIRTFMNLQGVPVGFDAGNVLTFKVTPSGERYRTAALNQEFQRRIVERLQVLPGVEAAAVTTNLPLDQPFRTPIWVAGSAQAVGSIQFRAVSPAYFQVLKTTLRAGREFTDADTGNNEPIALVNEAFAKQFLTDLDPLAQSLTYQGPNSTTPRILRRVVGVIGDVKQFGLREAAPPTVFIPAAQVDDGLTRVLRRFLPTTFVLRTQDDPLLLSHAVKQVIEEEDPQLAVTAIRSLEQVVARALATDRFYTSLLGIFAALGLLLATIGIYGAVSYNVAQRIGEIGIRMALGAQQRDVLALVLRSGMRLTAIGMVFGIGGAAALTRLLSSLLFGVSAFDPVSFAAIVLLLTSVALIACYLPARRATKVNPLVALRYE